MLILGFIETALELVPEEILQDPLILRNAKERGKSPEQLLLDEAVHSPALQKLPDAEKRGRPDIVHRGLLAALDSVLARAGQLEIFIHTYADRVILVNSQTRLPRRVPRFIGLIEQLFVTHRVPLQGPPLLELYSGTLKSYLEEVGSSKCVLLTKEGRPTPPARFAQMLLAETKPVVLIGGFAHGSVNSGITPLVDEQVSFDPESLSTTTVVGMLIHSIENALDLAAHRFNPKG